MKSTKKQVLFLSSKGKTIEELAKEAKNCTNCDLWRRGTQTVFGAGGSRAKIMFIGEQPGNQEDIEGKPFVGPAGKLWTNCWWKQESIVTRCM